MDKPLFGRDIYNLLRGQTNVILYSQLPQYSSVAELLHPYGNAVILYPDRSDSDGHWTGLHYTFDDSGRRVVEFFDPYGISVDREWRFTRSRYPNYLAQLLLSSPLPVHYNQHRIQKFKKGINTCGRHVVNRILNSNLSLQQYWRAFGGPGADRLVTQLIN